MEGLFFSHIVLLSLRNEKIGQFHSILTPNLYIRVFPNGDVLYSIRYVTISDKCTMH